MIIELLSVIASKLSTLAGAPGPSVVAQASGFSSMEVEFYGVSGLRVSPPKDDRIIFLPVGGGRDTGVAVAGHNYKIEIATAQGDTVLYSTDANGALKSKIHLRNDGKIDIETDGDVTMDITGNVSIDTTGNAEISAEGDVSISAEGDAIVDANEIQLNGSSTGVVKWLELNTSVQTFIGTLNTLLGTKQDGLSTPAMLTLDISTAQSTDVVTG